MTCGYAPRVDGINSLTCYQDVHAAGDSKRIRHYQAARKTHGRHPDVRMPDERRDVTSAMTSRISCRAGHLGHVPWRRKDAD